MIEASYELQIHLHSFSSFNQCCDFSHNRYFWFYYICTHCEQHFELCLKIPGRKGISEENCLGGVQRTRTINGIDGTFGPYINDGTKNPLIYRNNAPWLVSGTYLPAMVCSRS